MWARWCAAQLNTSKNQHCSGNTYSTSPGAKLKYSSCNKENIPVMLTEHVFSHWSCFADVKVIFSLCLHFYFGFLHFRVQLYLGPYMCFKQISHEYVIPFFSLPNGGRDTAAECCLWCFCPIYWLPPASLLQCGASSLYQNNISSAAHDNVRAGQVYLHSLLSRFWNLCAWMNDCRAFFRAS